MRLLKFAAFIACSTLCVKLLHAEQPTLNPHLEPLRPLLGKTWKGTFKDSKPEKPTVDVVRWERVLNGQGVRVMHSINQGVYGGARILEADTVRLMLTRQNATTPHQGLCWATEPHEGQPHWFHDGADPGIRTSMSFRPSDGVGVVVFINRTGVELKKLNNRLFRESARF